MMKRSRGKTRWDLIIILVIAVSLTYALFRYLYPPQSADIFLITPSTSVTGNLVKDTTIGVEGNYLLVLANGDLILLDIQGMDSFVNQTVSVSGVLSPSTAKGLPMTMTVNSITPN